MISDPQGISFYFHSVLIRFTFTMITMMMMCVMSVMRSGFLYGSDESSHSFLVSLEAISFLQLSEAGSAGFGCRYRSCADAAPLALRSWKSLPGSLLLYEGRRGTGTSGLSWRCSEEYEKSFSSILGGSWLIHGGF